MDSAAEQTPCDAAQSANLHLEYVSLRKREGSISTPDRLLLVAAVLYGIACVVPAVQDESATLFGFQLLILSMVIGTETIKAVFSPTGQTFIASMAFSTPMLANVGVAGAWILTMVGNTIHSRRALRAGMAMGGVSIVSALTSLVIASGLGWLHVGAYAWFGSIVLTTAVTGWMLRPTGVRERIRTTIRSAVCRGSESGGEFLGWASSRETIATALGLGSVMGFIVAVCVPAYLQADRLAFGFHAVVDILASPNEVGLAGVLGIVSSAGYVLGYAVLIGSGGVRQPARWLTVSFGLAVIALFAGLGCVAVTMLSGKELRSAWIPWLMAPMMLSLGAYGMRNELAGARA